MSSVTKSGYRDLMTRAFLLWAVVSLASKAPVAMAPLALVFLSRESPVGYTLGATLASVYVLGEVVGAPLLGTRLARGRMRGQLSAGLMVGALAFGALPLAHSAPAPVLTVLAFLAGAGLSQLVAQVVLTSAPVVLALAGGSPADVTTLFAAMALFRAPYLLVQGSVAPLTVRLTRLVVARDVATLARVRRGLVGLAAARRRARVPTDAARDE